MLKIKKTTGAMSHSSPLIKKNMNPA